MVTFSTAIVSTYLPSLLVCCQRGGDQLGLSSLGDPFWAVFVSVLCGGGGRKCLSICLSVFPFTLLDYLLLSYCFFSCCSHSYSFAIVFSPFCPPFVNFHSLSLVFFSILCSAHILLTRFLDPPTVNASLGRSLRPELLKEGDDVYFTCSVAANPPATSITWYHKVGSEWSPLCSFPYLRVHYLIHSLTSVIFSQGHAVGSERERWRHTVGELLGAAGRRAAAGWEVYVLRHQPSQLGHQRSRLPQDQV